MKKTSKIFFYLGKFVYICNMIFKRGIEVKESLNIGAEANAYPVAEVYFEALIEIYNTNSGEVKDTRFICDTIDPTRTFEMIEAGEDYTIPLKARLKMNFKHNEHYQKGLFENIRVTEFGMTFICEAKDDEKQGGVIIPENHRGDFFKVGEKYYKLPELK